MDDSGDAEKTGHRDISRIMRAEQYHSKNKDEYPEMCHIVNPLLSPVALIVYITIALNSPQKGDGYTEKEPYLRHRIARRLASQLILECTHGDIFGCANRN